MFLVIKDSKGATWLQLLDLAAVSCGVLYSPVPEEVFKLGTLMVYNVLLQGVWLTAFICRRYYLSLPYS